MKQRFWVYFVVQLALAFGCTRASTALSIVGEGGDLTSQFTVDSSTQVPGKVLKPGQYTIRILDHLSDRVIVRIEGKDGKSEGIFLALPNPALAGSRIDGPISWTGGARKTLRGYQIAGSAVEFVYPKEEAVEIAKRSSEKVPAIDPKSEGRPAAEKLSSEDRQMVTLWMLSSTRVGPPSNSQPAINAERYVAPPTSGTQSAQVTEARAQPYSSAAVTEAGATKPKSAPVQMASMTRPAKIKALPHTASSLPLVLAGSLFCFLGAAVLGNVSKSKV